MNIIKFIIVFPLTLLIFRKARSMTKKIKRDPNLVLEEKRYFWMRKQCKRALWLYNIKVVPINWEYWPQDSKVLLVSNHQNNFDGLAIYKLNDFANCHAPVAFIAKKELLTHWLTKWFCNLIDLFFFDRQNLRDTYNIMQDIKECIKLPRSVVLFPEGTRSKSIRMKPFNSGLLNIAKATFSPILPLSINSCNIKSQLRLSFKKQYIIVRFNKLLRSNDIIHKDVHLLTDHVKRIIEKGVAKNQLLFKNKTAIKALLKRAKQQSKKHKPGNG